MLAGLTLYAEDAVTVGHNDGAVVKIPSPSARCCIEAKISEAGPMTQLARSLG